MLTYFTCSNSHWLKRWGKKLTSQIFFCGKNKCKNEHHQIYFLKLPNLHLTLCATKDVHNGSVLNCSYRSQYLSDVMLCVYRQWRRKLNPKGFHCVHVLCPVLSTRTDSLTNIHFPLYFTVEDVFDIMLWTI